MKIKDAISLIGEAISEGGCGVDVWEYNKRDLVVSIYNGGELSFV